MTMSMTVSVRVTVSMALSGNYTKIQNFSSLENFCKNLLQKTIVPIVLIKSPVPAVIMKT